MTRSLHLLLALLGLTFFVGCPTGDDDDSASDDDDSAAAETPDGFYLDSWGTFQTVSATTWTSGVYPDASTFAISQVGAGWLVAQNDANNAWSGGLWSRFDWHMDALGDLWFCQTAYDAADEAAALATAAADATDPANSGCGGFGWTQLIDHPQGPWTGAGDYIDAYGSHHSLRQGTWQTRAGSDLSSYALSQYSNGQGWAVGQNGADNAYFPNLWSRFDLAEHQGLWYLCQSAYDAADEAAALATAAADSSDPTAAGCSGFPWTHLGLDQGLLALTGSYTDGWGTDHVVEPWQWTTAPGVPGDEAVYAVAQYNNDAGWAIAQNAATNTYSPGLWSRFDWSIDQGDTWMCQTAYDAATADDALATSPADATDPATAGCGGFGWTNLTP